MVEKKEKEMRMSCDRGSPGVEVSGADRHQM